MSEEETMRKYAEAHGLGELRLTGLTNEQMKNLKSVIESEPSHIHIEMDSPVRPLPCVRDEHGEITEQTVKQLFAKVDEELNEMKEAVYFSCPGDFPVDYIKPEAARERIAEEAADTITAITTLLEALGIDAKMRDEAQRRVNAKNRERNRLCLTKKRDN